MDRLEIPFQFSGDGVHRDERIAVQVGAFAVAAPEIRRRAAERHVDHPALFVERHGESPHVHARAIFPAVVFPRLVAGLARLRNGMEIPQLLAGADIVGARIAGRPDGIFADYSRRRWPCPYRSWAANRRAPSFPRCLRRRSPAPLPRSSRSARSSCVPAVASIRGGRP